jgi:hypothetical protein
MGFLALTPGFRPCSRLSGGSLPVTEVSALQQQDPFSVVERGAASKGGCSQDWLPHVPNPEND